MTTLGADKPRDWEEGDQNDLPMVATDIIYEGAAVGDNGSGYARPLVAGDPFRGFAIQNTVNAGAAGLVNVRVKTRGKVKLAVGSLAITDVGKPVYASDDDTFVLTASTNTPIGRVHRFISTGIGIVRFDAEKAGLGKLTKLTDSTTGTAGDTLDDTTSGQKDDVASLAAKVNAIIDMLG